MIKSICNLLEAKVPLRGIRGPYSRVKSSRKDFKTLRIIENSFWLGGKQLRNAMIKSICNLSEAKVPLRGIRGPPASFLQVTFPIPHFQRKQRPDHLRSFFSAGL